MAFRTKYLISTDAAVALLSAGHGFCDWLERFDPETCSTAEVAEALRPLTELSITGLGENPTERPRFRPFKPNEEWQRHRRKAARLSIDGYRTEMLPNDDGIPFTGCSLAYDLCDFYEFISNLKADRLAKLLGDRSWPYVQLRIKAAEQALRRKDDAEIDPFARINIRGRSVRFVSWRTSAWTHASESPEDERSATTLCGGKEAYHQHTHQQWTCFWCGDCLRALSGKRSRRSEVLDYLLGRTHPDKLPDLS